MVSYDIPSGRADKLVKLFHDCISGNRSIRTSNDAKLFFEAIDVICKQKPASMCVESILSTKKGIEALSTAVRSNTSSVFVTTTSIGFLQHLANPQVKTLNDGQFLTDILVAILLPPTFWNALKRAYDEDALDQGNLVNFAWLCLEIASTQSSDLKGLFAEVKALNESKPLIKSSNELVRDLAYRIQKVIQLRETSATASINVDYSPGGRHDNDFADFREISIYPTADEMLSSQKPFLQRLDDVFEVSSETRARNHLDWLFRLLREDMLGEMREDLQIAWGKRKSKRKSQCLSKLELFECDVGTVRSTRPLTLWLRCYEGIQFPRGNNTASARKKYLEDFKQVLKHNSFGALCMNERIIAFGSLVRDVDRLAADLPAVGIQFTDAAGLKRAMVELLGVDQQHLKFFLVDTATFAYEPVLQRLKEITQVPLESELLSLEGQATDYQPPTKIKNLLEIMKGALLEGKEVDLSLHVPMKTAIRVRDAQLKSLINGLERPVGQIQGPPGTGKSFIGALLILIIMKLTEQRILVLSYTNHALDQFLEDLMKAGIEGGHMVRLGSKATPKTEDLRLENRQKESRYRQTPQSWAKIDSLKLEFAEVSEKLEEHITRLRVRIGPHDILGMLEFSEHESHFWEAFQVDAPDDGFHVMGRNNRMLRADDVYRAWVEGKHINSLKGLGRSMSSKARSAWYVSPNHRRTLDARWTSQVLQEQIEDFVQLAERSNYIHRQLDSIFKEGKREILRNKRVIGCTTTAAAMYQSIIKAAEPHVVMVEEAGEILEAHVISALGPSVKQLILIGDHKQLRPKVNNYKLTLEGGEGYDLNVSLFERLIRQGHHFTTLQEQHRSHPDISYFARLLAYDELKDHPKTLNRQKILGVQNRVVYVHHEHPEEQLAGVVDRRDASSKESKKNLFEAEMVLKTVKYLSQQGYKSENMVVLTPYLGQLSMLKQKLSEINDPYLNDLDSHELVRAGLINQAVAKASKGQGRLHLSTVDNYQGEESDIVIVSMARSNDRGDIGFLIARERLVVLMSRARAGIILFGNMNTFMKSKKGGEMWKTYFNAMKEKGFLFDGVPVYCEQHPNRSALLKTPLDFDQHCPDGGCAELCGAMLSCQKHKCERRCHRLSDHSGVSCTKMMQRTCERGHKVKFPCGNDKQGCRNCAREDEDNRRRIQRDLDMEKTRLEREDQYRKELQKMEDEIDHHRRVMKYKQEEEDQKKAIAEKKAQLQSLKEMQARMDAAKKTADEIKAQSKHGNEDKQKVNRVPLGKAGQEWDAMKKNEGASNASLDKLMELIGLESVKQEFLSVKSMVDTKLRQGASLSHERLSCSLLGNPGTGKTTVARLWGSFLTDVGAIAGNDFKETTGSKLANLGVSGCEKLLEEIKDNGGGVLFIDEAYQLSSGNNPGGAAVLDFLLAEVENLRGKVVFVLAGYAKQMESFFAHNPGFPSRFPIEMKFEDYTDEELREILEMQVGKKFDGRMQVEDGLDGLYFRIAARRVGRGRGKEGFGNARAIENALAKMDKRQATRIRDERRAAKTPNDFFYTKEDIIGPEPSAALESCKAWQKLNQMIGLNAVKEQAKTLMDSLKTNYERELAEEPLLEFSLNRVFLGSPGTGKTTVAKLYGQILADLGLLSNGEVLIKTPADFIGSVLGQSEANTKGILAASIGKVLVIDEAYGLYGGSSSVADPYKTAVVDTIVAEVQNVPGDDRCVIMIGYQEQMEQMFQNVNPGLSRRFSVDNPFVFEDFDDDGLRQVLELKLKISGFTTTGEGKRAALDVLIRERNRPNFGNGGAIENLLSKAKLSYQKRMSSGKVKVKRNQLEPVDFDEDFERSTRKDTNVRQLFQDDIGREEIIEMLEKIQSRVRELKSLDMPVEDEIPFNFLFRGPPGTGKSTTARKMGKVYYDMGFLADATVKDCSASDLTGQYVGETVQKVQRVLESALGKVLLIDEAYRLAEGPYAKEAIDEIVDSLTKPKYQGKLIVILAGYDNDINRLLAVNPGLSSRFPETVNFAPLSAEACWKLLVNLLQKRKTELSSRNKDLDLSCLESPPRSSEGNAVDKLKDLAALEGWASARDIKTLARNIFRAVNLSAKTLKLEDKQVLLELDKMLQERRGRLNTGSGPMLNGGFPEMNFGQPPPPPSFSTSMPFHTKAAEQHTAVEEQEQPAEEAEPVIEKVDNSRFGPAIRDAGVSDAVWEQLQRDRAEAERRDNEYHELLKAQKTASDADREKIVRQLVEEERRRKLEMEMQARLAAAGKCPAGFNWIKQSSGYRCAGGSHFMSDDELKKLM